MGRRLSTCGFNGFIIAACALAVLVGVAGEVRAEPEAVRAVAERVEAARERIESASYRIVLNQEFMPREQQGDGDAPLGAEVRNNQITMEVAEQGPFKRVRRELIVRGEGGEPDRESHGEAVINHEGIGLWRGGPTPVVIHEHEGIDRASAEVLERFELAGGRDYLRFGFGIGMATLHDALRAMPDAERWQVREVGPRGARLIEVRWYRDAAAESPAARLTVDPQRGDLVTRFTQYHPDTGEVLIENEVEPMLVEDHHGEAIWFPGTVRQERWGRDAEGGRRLRSHRIYRFEDVKMNRPMGAEAFSFVNALTLGERSRVQHVRLDQRIEVLAYEEGELVPTGQFVLRQTRDGRLMDGTRVIE